MDETVFIFLIIQLFTFSYRYVWVTLLSKNFIKLPTFNVFDDEISRVALSTSGTTFKVGHTCRSRFTYKMLLRPDFSK